MYQNWKSAAGLSDDDVRELMPECVIAEVRKRFPNPPGIPYMEHKRAWKYSKKTFNMLYHRGTECG